VAAQKFESGAPRCFAPASVGWRTDSHRPEANIYPDWLNSAYQGKRPGKARALKHTARSGQPAGAALYLDDVAVGFSHRMEV